MTRGRVVALLACVLLASGASPARGQTCPGDCDSNGEISLGEVAGAFKVYLGTAEFEFCTPADLNENGAVSLGEVQVVFSAFLDTCGLPPAE